MSKTPLPTGHQVIMMTMMTGVVIIALDSVTTIHLRGTGIQRSPIRTTMVGHFMATTSDTLKDSAEISTGTVHITMVDISVTHHTDTTMVIRTLCTDRRVSRRIRQETRAIGEPVTDAWVVIQGGHHPRSV